MIVVINIIIIINIIIRMLRFAAPHWSLFIANAAQMLTLINLHHLPGCTTARRYNIRRNAEPVEVEVKYVVCDTSNIEWLILIPPNLVFAYYVLWLGFFSSACNLVLHKVE